MRSQNLTGLNDADLLAKCNEGNKAAFAEIYDRYWGLLYIHAFKMLRNEDEAKDLVQELFTSVWLKSASLQLTTTLSAYLYASIRNRVLNQIAHNTIRENYLASLSEYLTASEPLLTDYILEKELAVLIEKEVKALPEKMRQVFEMSRKENLSHKEIALKLHISDKTVKKQVGNALKVLRFRLSHLMSLIVNIVLILYAI